MSDTRTLRERFLARTEQVRVRIPLDPDVNADLQAALDERRRIVAEHSKRLAAAEQGEARRKITDPDIPAEPDTATVDAWIEQAERAVDESSVVVVLQWKPKVYAATMKAAQADGITTLELSERMAEAYYLRAEEFTGDTWQDMELAWSDVAERLSEGEILEVGTQAQALATASDAAPFVKRGTSSKKG